MELIKIADDYYSFSVHRSEVAFDGDRAYIHMSLYDVETMGAACSVESQEASMKPKASTQAPFLDTVALDTISVDGMAVGHAEAVISQEDIDAEMGAYEYKREKEL